MATLAVFSVAMALFNPPSASAEPILQDETGPANADDALAIANLRDLRDAAMPDFAESEILADLGYKNWNAVPDSALDTPLGSVLTFSKQALAATEAELNNGGAQTKGLCGGRWKLKSKTVNSGPIGGGDQMAVAGGDSSTGVRFTGEAEMDGTVQFQAAVRYQERSNKCIGIPYRWEFVDANVDVVVATTGDLSLTNQLTVTHTRRLWSEALDLPKAKLDIPIAKVLNIELEASLQVLLAVDLTAGYTYQQPTSIAQAYQIDGSYEAHLFCDNSGCKTREDSVSDMSFTAIDGTGRQGQQTVDITVTPSADLGVQLGIDLELVGVDIYDVFDGKAGVMASLPIRFYTTAGNDCSDANGDGVSENVSTTLVDINAQLFGYLSGQGVGNDFHEWIDLKLKPSDGWVKKLIADPYGRAQSTGPAYSTNVLMSVLDQGEHSALEPLVRDVGRFSNGAAEFEGVKLAGIRSCYPFAESPTFDIDWGDGTTQRVAMAQGEQLVAHDWSNDGEGQTVKVRVANDATTRKIFGPWVAVAIGGGTDPAGECVDPDGDGWGWRGVWPEGESCQVG